MSLIVLSVASCDAEPFKSVNSASSVLSTGHQELLSFENIANGYMLAGGMKDPWLVVITNVQSLKAAKARLPGFNWEKTAETNLDIYAVLGIFWGVKPSGGYGVEVLKIVKEGSRVIITADLKEYGSGVDAATIPYEILRLRKGDLGQKGEMTFLLFDSRMTEVWRGTSYVY